MKDAEILFAMVSSIDDHSDSLNINTLVGACLRLQGLCPPMGLGKDWVRPATGPRGGRAGGGESVSSYTCGQKNAGELHQEASPIENLDLTRRQRGSTSSGQRAKTVLWSSQSSA